MSKTDAWVASKMSANYIHVVCQTEQKKKEIKTLTIYKMTEEREGSVLEHSIVRIKVKHSGEIQSIHLYCENNFNPKPSTNTV